MALYESETGTDGVWEVERNRGLLDSLFHGDESGYTHTVTYTPAQGTPGELWFAVMWHGGVLTHEPFLELTMLEANFRER